MLSWLQSLREVPGSLVLEDRTRCVVVVICLGWLVAGARLVQLQLIEQESLAGHSVRQSELSEEVVARPGDILDREGRLLATTVRCRSLYLVPRQLDRPWDISQQLATVLEIDPEQLFAKLSESAEKHFVWVQRRISDDAVEKIRALDLPKGTWGFRDEYRRVYPQGTLAAHVLGLRDVDGVGRGGIEEQFESQLHGVSGSQTLRRDATGRVVEVIEDPTQRPVAGAPLQLSLDAVLQLFTERELDELMTTWKPTSACAVVLDVPTGEVLAMASRPAFDPNRPELATADAWTNRVTSDVYEPGSTFKPFVVAYGLEHQLIARDDSFNCEGGQYRMGRRLLHDHHPYGRLSLTDVLVKSSNIGMAKIGEKLGNPGLWEAATQFGFGKVTGIELPGEQTGVLRPLDQWTGYSTGSIPMGHELSATPLQLINAHAALARGGRWQPATLRHRLNTAGVQASSGEVHQQDANAETTSPPAGQRNIVQAETANWVVQEPLTQVVERGTGRRARLTGYQVFGKTGTAQAMAANGGYDHGRYISSFLCGAPSAAPRVVVLVVVNQAQVGTETFGGKVAAPTAAAILEQSLAYLRVPAEGSSSRPMKPTASRPGATSSRSR